MKKTLRFSLLSMLMLLCSSVMAENVITFTAGTDKGEQTNASTGSDSMSKDGITISVSKGALAAAEYRTAKGETMTITSTVGNITKVEFTCTASGSTKYGPANFNNPTTGSYTYDANVGTWTGNAASLALTASGSQVRAKSIVVTVDGDPTGPTEPAEPTDSTTLTGNGTLEDPYTVADALSLIDELADGALSESNVYVKGIIAEVSDISISYGNAIFTIVDQAADTCALTFYRGKYLQKHSFSRKDQVKAGDTVVIYGKLQRYVKNGEMTPEMYSCYIYEHNGQTVDETYVEPVGETITVAEALEIINAMENGKVTTETYQVKGIVVGTPDFQRNNSGALYGNVNFDMADQAGGSPVLNVFRAYNFNNEMFTEETINQFAADYVVVVKGKLQKYVKNGIVKPEISEGYLISVEEPDITDAIGGVQTTESNTATVYNLRGQRVAQPRRGLYIVNGQKVVVK